MTSPEQPPPRSRRISGHRTFYDKIVPFLLVAFAVMTIAMIAVAAAVLFNVIAWR